MKENTPQIITTPFKNRIHHRDDGLSVINYIDFYKVPNIVSRNFIVITSSENAIIYNRIEERVCNANQEWLTFPLRSKNASSWGFINSYRPKGQSWADTEEYLKKLLWIRFVSYKPKAPKVMRIVIHEDIYNRYSIYFKNSNIPQKLDNFEIWNQNGSHLVIQDYISENTIDEIMDVIVRIPFKV